MCRLQVGPILKLTSAYAAHLVKRFFAYLRARPLGPREQGEVEALLAPAERELFWSQNTADRRHGLETARRVLSVRPGDRLAARAGLLHDVGKRHARLGPVGRSLATLLRLAGFTPPGRLGTYVNHPSLGGEDLEAVGAEPLVVAFARHHPHRAPEGFDDALWEVLLAADHGEKMPDAPPTAIR